MSLQRESVSKEFFLRERELEGEKKILFYILGFQVLTISVKGS